MRGSAFSGGYQFLRSHHARITRGHPIRSETVPGVGTVTITPMLGGRRRFWEVAAQWQDAHGNTFLEPEAVYDELEASIAFRRALDRLKMIHNRKEPA